MARRHCECALLHLSPYVHISKLKAAARVLSCRVRVLVCFRVYGWYGNACSVPHVKQEREQQHMHAPSTQYMKQALQYIQLDNAMCFLWFSCVCVSVLVCMCVCVSSPSPWASARAASCAWPVRAGTSRRPPSLPLRRTHFLWLTWNQHPQISVTAAIKSRQCMRRCLEGGLLP